MSADGPAPRTLPTMTARPGIGTCPRLAAHLRGSHDAQPQHRI